MANWDNPLLTTLYAAFLSDLKARDSDLAKMFDVGTPTNLETDTIRWNSTAGRFEKWNGTAWVELASVFNINVDKLDGSDSSAFAAAAHVGSGGGSHADVTGSVDGFMTAADKATLDAATSAATVSTLMKRSGTGRVKVVAPAVSTDIALKSTVDDHANLTSPHSATSAATASRLIVRDAAGRAKVVDPSVAADIATKNYADNLPVPPNSRTISTGTGLSGGGDLSADRTLNLDITGLISFSAPAAGDELPIEDVGVGRRKITVANILKVVNLLPEDIAPQDGDFLLEYDVNTNVAKKAKISNIVPGQATKAAIEAQTNEDTYAPPDLIKHSPGVAKAWCYVTVTAGVPTLQVDHGVTSIDDDGIGEFGVNFDTTFSSANYAGEVTGNLMDGNRSLLTWRVFSRLVGSAGIVFTFSSNNLAAEPNDFSASFFGDQ